MQVQNCWCSFVTKDYVPALRLFTVVENIGAIFFKFRDHCALKKISIKLLWLSLPDKINFVSQSS